MATGYYLRFKPGLYFLIKDRIREKDVLCVRCKKEKSYHRFRVFFKNKDLCVRGICRLCYAQRHARPIPDYQMAEFEDYRDVLGRYNAIKKEAMIYNRPISDDFTLTALKELFTTNNQCYYCTNVITKKEYKALDVKVPFRKKGDCNMSNICVCCRTCNRLKGNMTEEEFMTFLTNFGH